MRYIYLNGCSFVVGLGVEKEKTIIDIISKKLNCEYFNDSRDGASNDYIKRTTMSWLLENEDKLLLANQIYKQISPRSIFNWHARIRKARNLEILGNNKEAVSLLNQMSEEKKDRYSF